MSLLTALIGGSPSAAQLKEHLAAELSELEENEAREVAALQARIRKVQKTTKEKRSALEAKHTAEVRARRMRFRADALAAFRPLVKEFSEGPTRALAVRFAETFQSLDARCRHEVGERLGGQVVAYAFACLEVEKRPEVTIVFAHRLLVTQDFTPDRCVPTLSMKVAACLRRGGAIQCLEALEKLESAVSWMALWRPDREDPYVERRWQALLTGDKPELEAIAAEEKAAARMRAEEACTIAQRYMVEVH